ncbi:MAG TPA: hypothetical protein V6C81_01825 [Planktothrix sp.]
MPTDKYQTLRFRAVLALVAVAAMAASSVKALQSSCEACAAASTYSPIPHASLVGTIFYASLAFSLWRFKLNGFSKAALYLAAGCHIILLMELAQLHLFCIPCVTCGCCALVASLIAMSGVELTACASIAMGVVGMTYATDLSARWQKTVTEKDTRELIGYDKLPLKQKGALPMFVFERKDCPICQDFNALYLPKLLSVYGKKVVVHIAEAPKEISTPTIVLGGAEPKLWNYSPTWKRLSAAIEDNLHRDNNNRQVAATPHAQSY